MKATIITEYIIRADRDKKGTDVLYLEIFPVFRKVNGITAIQSIAEISNQLFNFQPKIIKNVIKKSIELL